MSGAIDDLDPTDLGLDSGRNSECVEQVRRTVLASENYEVATLPLKTASSRVMKRLQQLLLLVRKGVFALDLVLQFH